MFTNLVRSINLFLVFILILPIAQGKEETKNSLDLQDLNLKEIVLPSEVEQIPKMSGSVYYNKSTKGKVLIPVNYWGQVSKAGLHFIPAETNFISGLSMAGGPSTNSKLDNIKLIRKTDDGIKIKEFDLTEGGDTDSYMFKLQPNDTVFVERSTYYEDRSYYTSLVSVFVTLLSGYVIYQQIDQQK